jgi:DNA-binding protein H-NS
MSEFLAILTHGRKLQGAVKNLSVLELETVAQKLAGIIEVRKQKEAEQQQQDLAKKAKLADILQQMQDAGIEMADLQQDKLKKPGKPQQKRPVKYTLRDEKGDTHQWTGIGRMPKIYSKAIASGKKLSDFLL